MLAYVDDLLEPADAQDVGKKINESEFATGLMHRMRDVTRRLRLGAPKLHGKGMGHDANTVAEYLDNRLLSERVADFEKVCLESDVHLAEVASCHQILALVLGEPAEIESTSRQRMYGLIHQADSAPRSSSAVKDERKLREAARAVRRKKKRRKPKVPEYLREPAQAESKKRSWGGVLVAVGLLAAACIGLGLYWPEISRRFQVAQRVQPPDNSVAVNNQQAADTATSTSNNAAGNDVLKPSNGKTAADAQPVTDNGDAAVGEPSPPEASEEPMEPEASEAATDRSKVAGTNKKPKSKPVSDDGQADEKANDGSESAMPDQEPNTRTADGGANGDTKASQTEAATAGEGIGRLISEHDVLLRAADDQWQRVPSRGTVHVGERLVALPTYRPSVAMSNGVTLQLLGGANVSLGPNDDDGAAQIQLSSGRILLLTVAKPDTKVRLQAGDYQGTIEFGKQEAALAVEVRHLLPEGADPEQEAAPTAVDLYLSSGEATWTDRKGRSEKLSGRSRRSLGSRKGSSQAEEDLPTWIESNELNPNERRASTEVESFLRPDKVVGSALADLATHRRIENSLLAAQSLALIDDFGPIVALLNEPKFRVNWTPMIDTLRAALARSPQTAALVRAAFETRRSRELGDKLYRMLWGYNSQQLEDGAAAQLIEWLDAPDDQLDFRVLSFWNLHHITGLGLYYQPADPEKQRRTSIQRWKQKLDSGLIVPKSA
jgi:hypothetical protein